ncbi:MAG TPA: hypothetical protein VM285_12055 [Polyangia bacterium]|nr:hypothetical protein [Polyangia bacterium]
MFERDYILRMVKQLGDAVARIMGLKVEEDYEEALRVIDRALEELLGLDLLLLRMIDAASISEMMRDNHQLFVYLKLELEEIDVLRRMNEHQRADRLLVLIEQVGRACIARHGNPDEELRMTMAVINAQRGDRSGQDRESSEEQ